MRRHWSARSKSIGIANLTNLRTILGNFLALERPVPGRKFPKQRTFRQDYGGETHAGNLRLTMPPNSYGQKNTASA
jgi:hypothetical protein